MRQLSRLSWEEWVNKLGGDCPRNPTLNRQIRHSPQILLHPTPLCYFHVELKVTLPLPIPYPFTPTSH